MIDTEIWNCDRTWTFASTIAPDFMEQEGGHKQGGKWLREASIAIAREMLANQAVQIKKNYNVEYDNYTLLYVVRAGTPNGWRQLPK